jgi:hypothetical protein
MRHDMKTPAEQACSFMNHMARFEERLPTLGTALLREPVQAWTVARNGPAGSTVSLHGRYSVVHVPVRWFFESDADVADRIAALGMEAQHLAA